MCCAKVQIGRDTHLTIIGVYLPSDGYTEDYKCCLIDLEELLSSLNPSQPVLIVGDFNAHLADQGRGNSAPNAQGLALRDLVEKYNLYVASLDERSTGPSYTYSHGDTKTIVDYVFANQCASYLIKSTAVLEDHPLNTSDHLPVYTSLEVNPVLTCDDVLKIPQVNWSKVGEGHSIGQYQTAINDLIRPLIDNDYDNVTQIERELKLVSTGIKKFALNHLPLRKKHSPRNRFRDGELQKLCKESKRTWMEWVNVGRPKSGDLYEKKARIKREVRRRINILEAVGERRRLQRIDENFRNRCPRRFVKPKSSVSCSKLRIDGRSITEESELLQAWKSHFSALSNTNITDAEVAQALQEELRRMTRESNNNDEFIFDIEFESEEVGKAIQHLRNGKAAGPDGVSAEHLKFGGSLLVTWITQIFNAILILETVPSSFKVANITPIYKGKGKDPLNPNNYRGIGVSNVFGKLFESLTLSRMLPELESKGFPVIQQTAYQKGISCEDATFAVFETLNYLIRNGNTVLQTFYDLEKAFDSVEYCILLKHLYSRGVNGKCWRIIKGFYDRPTACVKVNGSLSQEYVIKRGVRQGSVLSPSLFLLLIDSLLQTLKEANAGVNLEGIYMGSLAHADDIRSLTCDPQSCKQQAQIIIEFLGENFLQLNADKCEMVVHTHGSRTQTISVDIGSVSLESSNASKCLGTWWTPDLAPTKAITENISSARRAFFSFGSMGVFQGHLNPLSSRSVVETCVMSVLLFGSESWYLSDTALDGLERFQGWIGKRILRLTCFHSNTTVHIGLDWPSMRARVLMRKLNYLRQLVGVSEDKLSSQIFHAFAGRDVSELTIIEQCRHLESVYEINFTSEILTSADSWASIQKRILSADKELRVNRANTRRSLKHLSAIHSEISWLKIWDMVLDYGIQGSKSALCLFGTLSHPLFGDRPCPRCKTSIPEDVTYLEHLTCNHQELELSSVEKIMELLISASPDLITVGYRLSSMPPS